MISDSSLPYVSSGITVAASNSFNDSLLDDCGWSNSGEVWYEYSPLSTKVVELSLSSDTYATVSRVFRGNCSSPICFLRQNGPLVTRRSGHVWLAQTGSTYFPVVSQLDGEGSFNIELVVRKNIQEVFRVLSSKETERGDSRTHVF